MSTEPVRLMAAITATLTSLVALGVVALTDVQTEAILGMAAAWLGLLGVGAEVARSKVTPTATDEGAH